MPSDAGQGLSVLELDRLELTRRQAEDLEDGRSDLRRLDTVVDPYVLHARAPDDDRYVPVLPRVAAVLGVSVGYVIQGGTQSASDSTAEDAVERALLRLYRACSEEDRAFLMRAALRLARTSNPSAEPAAD